MVEAVGGTGSGDGTEVWRGSVNAWECDQMGHMNARFYSAIVLRGLVGAAAALGLPDAFRAGARATLMVRGQHIRFLREARVGAPLHTTTGIVSMDAGEAEILFLVRHSGSGDLAASFRTTVAPADPVSGAALPWSDEARSRAERLRVEVPAEAAPRSVDLGAARSAAALSAADGHGLVCGSRGAFGPEHCDVFGRVRVDAMMGAIADGMPLVGGLFRGDLASHLEDPPQRMGGAMIEYRLLCHGAAAAGDRYELRTGLAGVDGRTMRIVHWLLDPESGRPWLTAEGVSLSFDLDARKAIAIPPAAQAAMQAVVTPGLTL